MLILAFILFSLKDYNNIREKIMENERLSSLGGHIWLNSAEDKANSILMNAKRAEVGDV